MRNRSSVLELAILALLHRAPMHGYELRKQLNTMLGPFRALSYGTLYPALRGLVDKGLTADSGPEVASPGAVPRPGTRRARIVYSLTPAGAAALESMLGEAGPASWEDDYFDVRFAFFAQTEPTTRLRVLEGRRLRMAERLHALASRADRARGADPYARELHRHAVEQVEREIHWLDDLVAAERAGLGPTPGQTQETGMTQPAASDAETSKEPAPSAAARPAASATGAR